MNKRSLFKWRRGMSLFVLIGVILLQIMPQAAWAKEVPRNRLFGQDRYQTARAIAEDYSEAQCDNVILTSGNGFQDALSAAILSKKLNAPILLVDTNVDASSEAFNYISKHLMTSGYVYIIGGTAVIGTEFETKLASMGYSNIRRLGGHDQYDTDMQIVDMANVPEGSPVFIASGEYFPDALSVSGFSGFKQYPMLLVGANYLPDKTLNYIDINKPATVYIIGGLLVVSQNIQDQIKEVDPKATVKRLAGSDRFETAALVLNEFSISSQNIYLANGYSFPDALAGSSLAAKTGDPIILVDNQISTLPPAIETYLAKIHAAGVKPNVWGLGGSSVVPDSLIERAKNVLNGDVLK